jgi:hypothetical protein
MSPTMGLRIPWMNVWVACIALGGGLVGLPGFVVVLHQILHYLRHGVWQSWSVVDGLLYLTRDNPPLWLMYPQEWVGAHKILQALPLSLVFAVSGILTAIFIVYLGIKLQEFRDVLKEKANSRGKQ